MNSTGPQGLCCWNQRSAVSVPIPPLLVSGLQSWFGSGCFMMQRWYVSSGRLAGRLAFEFRVRVDWKVEGCRRVELVSWTQSQNNTLFEVVCGSTVNEGCKSKLE